MKSVSIGYSREDGDFAILATLNNNDQHMSDDAFFVFVQKTVTSLSYAVELPLRVLEREDTPDYVAL